MVQTELCFDVKEPDIKTLNGIVLDLLRRGNWFMPHELISLINLYHSVFISDSSCTARLRDLRKPQFGSHTIEKRIRDGSRAYEYRLVQ